MRGVAARFIHVDHRGEERVHGDRVLLATVQQQLCGGLVALLEEKLLLDRKRILDRVSEGFAHPLDAEDVLCWKVDENFLHELCALEDRLHCGCCGRIWRPCYVGDTGLGFLAKQVSDSIRELCNVRKVIPRLLRRRLTPRHSPRRMATLSWV